MSNTIYLIVDRYDRGEFYNIYGKGIYTDFDEAAKDWKEILKSFLSTGPDDVYLLGLVSCDLDDIKLKELEDHINKLNIDEYYNANKDYTKFMDENIDIYNAIYGPEGYDSIIEIQEMIENDGKDCEYWENKKVFTKYFNRYYRQHYL